MEELEFLKKNWNKNTFSEVSEADIYNMLQKNSSTTVKWIFYVSMLEFVFLNALGFFLADSKYDEFIKNYPIFNYLEYVNYAVVLLFIFLFYKNYKDISVLNNAKNLMEVIIKTRKVVTYYIYWNIIIGAISGAYAGLKSFELASNNHIINTNISIFVFTIITIIFLVVLWLFYKLLYGRFLNKLKYNYKELIKIDL